MAPTNITYDILARILDVREAGPERLEKMHEGGILMGCRSGLLSGRQSEQPGDLPLGGGYVQADAVRSTTVDSAKVLRMEEQIGTITSGAAIDIIAADGNPLEEPDILVGQGANILTDGTVVKKAALL